MKTVTFINGRVVHAISTRMFMSTCCGAHYTTTDYKHQEGDNKVTCKACIRKMAVKAAEGNKKYNGLLSEALGLHVNHKGTPAKSALRPVGKPGFPEEYPLYVYITVDQEAYLHQGSATTPEEAMQHLSHITEDSSPVAILEVKSCKMYKFSEVKERFCPACGATGAEVDDCYCAK